MVGVSCGWEDQSCRGEYECAISIWLACSKYEYRVLSKERYSHSMHPGQYPAP